MIPLATSTKIWTIDGGDGNDSIEGDFVGTVYGRTGDDTISFTDAGGFVVFGNEGDNSIFMDMAAGIADRGDGDPQFTEGVVHGGQNDDTIEVDATASYTTAVVYGNLGDDWIDANAGSNSTVTLFGGHGADPARQHRGGPGQPRRVGGDRRAWRGHLRLRGQRH